MTVNTTSSAFLQSFLHLNVCIRLLMGLIAVFSNLLTVIAITHYEYLRSCTNYLIAALAVADIIGGCNCLTLVINYVVPTSDATWTSLCAFEQTLSDISSCGNVLVIFWISLDRFIFIMFPLRYHSLISNRVTAGMVLSTIMFTIWVVSSFNCCGYQYIPFRVCRGIVFKSSRFYMWISFFAVTSLTILLHSSIAIVAYQHSQQITEQNGPHNTNEYKITKMLSMVLGIYLACYLPQITTLLISNFTNPGPNFLIIERISSWFWWINAWANPLVYAWKNKDFNRAFRNLLHMKTTVVHPA